MATNVNLPVVEGQLEKQGEKWPKRWKSRWFALDGKKLFYYHKKADFPSNPISSIPLERATLIQPAPIRSGPKFQDCGFIVEASQRKYYLCGSSNREMKQWVVKLNKVLSILYPGREIPANIQQMEESLKTLPPSPTTAGQDQAKVDEMMKLLEQQNKLMESTSTKDKRRTIQLGTLRPETTSNMATSPKFDFVTPVPKSRSVTTVNRPNVNGSPTPSPPNNASTQPSLPSPTPVSRRQNPHAKSMMVGPSSLQDQPSVPIQTNEGNKILESLRRNLVERDKEINAMTNNLKNVEIQLADLQEKYFVSIAVFAKMNQTSQGQYCNIDVYDLYDKAIAESVPSIDWPHWVTEQIQINAIKETRQY